METKPYRLIMKKNPYKGKLITFSGIDGSGKTTLAKLLYTYLDKKGVPVFQYKTPSIKIKQYSYQKEYELSYFNTDESKLDLFSLCTISLGDRYLLLKKSIIQQLKEGAIVICDRYVFTAFVEMLSFNLPKQEVRLIKQLIKRFLQPDLAFFLEVDPEIAFKRIVNRNNKDEQFYDENKLRLSSKFFLKVASNNDYSIVLSQNESIENSFGTIKNNVDDLLAKK